MQFKLGAILAVANSYAHVFQRWKEKSREGGCFAYSNTATEDSAVGRGHLPGSHAAPTAECPLVLLQLDVECLDQAQTRLRKQNCFLVKFFDSVF